MSEDKAEEKAETEEKGSKEISEICKTIEKYVTRKEYNVGECLKFIKNITANILKIKQRLIQRKNYERKKEMLKEKYKNTKKYTRCETCNRNILMNSMRYHQLSKRHMRLEEMK